MWYDIFILLLFIGILLFWFNKIFIRIKNCAVFLIRVLLHLQLELNKRNLGEWNTFMTGNVIMYLAGMTYTRSTTLIDWFLVKITKNKNIFIKYKIFAGCGCNFIGKSFDVWICGFSILNFKFDLSLNNFRYDLPSFLHYTAWCDILLT